MSNRTQLLARVRDELGDSGAVPIWTDVHLTNILIESVGWYSGQWPFHSTAYRDVVADQRVFDLPPGTMYVDSVELPGGTLLPQEAFSLTSKSPDTGYRQAWSVWGGSLYLRNPASGEEVGATRLAMKVALPWDRLDPVDAWNGPEDGERLLVIWTVWQAYEWLSGQDAIRGRATAAKDEAARYNGMLESEIAKRARRAGSRIMDVIR